MQIKISDMLDNASVLIEENKEVRNSTNNDRIKKIVFSEIGCTPENIVKKKGERNMRKKILKIMKWAGLILLGAAAALMIWNFICKQAEQSKIQAAYGTVVEVQGHNMVVDIKGEDNETTIILLPSWGSPSPVLEFLPLAEELSKDFRVITIEPFGYGLSDRIGTEREISAVVEELHECIQKLGCNQYYLMPHSLSSLYSMYWENAYPQEVKGFIGIDRLFPNSLMKSRYRSAWQH